MPSAGQMNIYLSYIENLMSGIVSADGSESIILELLAYSCVLNFCDGKT